jgi:hypothetical protein
MQGRRLIQHFTKNGHLSQRLKPRARSKPLRQFLFFPDGFYCPNSPRPRSVHQRIIKGRIPVKRFGHIDPLLAFPAVLQNRPRRKTVFNRISLRRTRNADDLL